MSEKEGAGTIGRSQIIRPCGLGHRVEISFYVVGNH